MPCQYYSDAEMNAGLRTDLNILTRVCCDMRTVLRKHCLLSKLTEESLRWILLHDEEDRLRIEQEEASGERQRVKRVALAKLNLEERRVLGL